MNRPEKRCSVCNPPQTERLAVFLTVGEARALYKSAVSSPNRNDQLALRTGRHKLLAAIERRENPDGDHYLGEANEGFEA